jgi:hypothetical protein
MDTLDANYEALKRQWTDKYVQVVDTRPELSRFRGLVGRVVTVNRNNKALIDFADGGWYDVTASTDYLTIVADPEAKAKYDATANSAQPFPSKQG